MSIGFLVTSPYQIFHYRHIAAHLPDCTVVIEERDKDYGLTSQFVDQHMPGCEIDRIKKSELEDLDGSYDTIVCQTPILPLKFLTKSHVVAQQYSLAKEKYQYGVWRSHAHLNLMYGPEAVSLVSGFSSAVPVGNPLLDPLRESGGSSVTDKARPRLLYLPTYGALSSVRDTLPRLARSDVDVTVKLHHASDAAILDELSANMSVVYADTDPVTLLSEHDGVISDMSGAVFDALYAGLPVVLTGMVNPLCEDYQRLSAREQDGTRYRDLAATWASDSAVMDAFADAERLRRGPAFQRFLADNFVNLGSAGAACAAEIQRLGEVGENPDFGVTQVRDATRRYIQRNRDLKVARSTTPKNNHPAGSKDSASMMKRVAGASVRRVKLKTRGVRRKLGLVRRPGKERFAQLTAAPSRGPRTPAPPAQQREALFEMLRPYLTTQRVRVVRDGTAPGAEMAMRKGEKRGLWRALRALAHDHPEVRIHIGTGSAATKASIVSDMYYAELVAADWLEIDQDDEGYALHSGRRLVVNFVDHDPERNRYFATRSVAKRPDWTEWFAARSPATVMYANDPPRRIAEPIDAVYTWVDPRCPRWQNAYSRFNTDEATKLNSSGNQERFADRDELRHSLRSLWMFAPFVRHVYIVTGDQYPAWLDIDDPRVSVVPHREIFPDDEVLPTFNSHAIEANLHRITGLSDNFVYFNDDVYLGREVTADDFFTLEGLPKARFSPSQFIYDGEPEPGAIPTDWAAYNSTQLIVRDFDRRFQHRLKHVPLPLNRRVLYEIEDRYPAELARTRAARFRSAGDIALPSMFAQYYAISTGRAVEWPNIKQEYVYLDTGREDSYVRFNHIFDWQPKFFCLNSTRHTVLDMNIQAKNLGNFLRKAFPVAAPWEKPVESSPALATPLAGSRAAL